MALQKKQTLIAVAVVLCLVVGLSAFYLIRLGREYVVDVESAEALDAIQDGILYVGRPTCPECAAFEPVLRAVARERRATVYYLNTDHIRQQSLIPEDQLKAIFAQYAVTEVPIMVAVTGGVPGQVFNVNRTILAGGLPDARAELVSFLAGYRYDTAGFIPHYALMALWLVAAAVLFLLAFSGQHRPAGGALPMAAVALMLLVALTGGMGLVYLRRVGFVLEPSAAVAAAAALLLSIAALVKSLIKPGNTEVQS